MVIYSVNNVYFITRQTMATKVKPTGTLAMENGVSPYRY